MHDRGAFVPTKELCVGDTLCLSDNRPAVVASITTEDAEPGQRFSTYNFEVEDYHTYFVGEEDAGVWVHNRGEGCEYVASLIRRFQEKDGSTPMEALAKVLDLSDFDEAGISLAEKKKRLARAARIDPHLHHAVKETMRRQYDLAVRPDGTVDLSLVPRVDDLMELMAKRSQRADNRDLYINAHHTIVKNDPAGSLWAQRLGVPADQIDRMPGVLVHIYEHQIGRGLADQPSFHTVFKDTLRDMINAGFDMNDVSNIRFLHEQAYEEWDPDFGPKIWKAAEAWLDSPELTP